MIATTKEIKAIVKDGVANNLDAFYENLDFELFYYWCKHQELTPISVNKAGLPWKRFTKSALYVSKSKDLFATVKNAEEIAQIIG